MTDNHAKIRDAANAAAIDNAINESVSIALQFARDLPEPLAHMEQEAQDMQIEQLDSRYRAMLKDLSSALGSSGFARIKATIDKVTFGKQVIANLVIPVGEDLHLLTDLKGAGVTIVHAPADKLFEKPSAAEPDPQMDLLAQAAVQLEADDPTGGDDRSEPDESDTDDEP